ncbi:THO complex subunit 1 [Hydra vulgaris]|uniref:THO complex subunit 1 n=1 Tax=Hydra vulgaris TaxID=6087 RepID=UPI001F5F8B3B|nr:THO complex subunit 1 [Hydra vulgaris]
MVVCIDSHNFDFLSMQNEVIDCISLKSKPYTTEAISKLFSKYEGVENDCRLATDQAFRVTLGKILYPSNNHLHHSDKNDISEKEMDKCISQYEELLDYVIIHAKEQFCTKNLPILLLSDIFDTMTLCDCEKMFKYIEKNVSIWNAEPFFSTGKNHLLRMCNDMLRRLSKSQNTVFCGRIQLFLAQLFPVEEKSALNLMSNFHLENVTLFKTEKLDFDEIQPNDSVEDRELVNNPVDYNLYIKFWTLQDYFVNPSKCYTKEGWNLINTNISEVLKIFTSFKLEFNVRKRKSIDMPIDVDQIKQTANNYFAKYLTNEKLFNFQLNDSNFRRNFLVQVLILFQYLSGTSKFKAPNQVLNDTQTNWINETTDIVYNSICETPPDGKKFCETIKHILSREENWINWKNEGCPSFAKVKSSTETEVAPKKAKRSIGDDFVLNQSKKINMGTLELTRLWNLNPDNLASAKVESRLKFLPNLKDFFEKAIEQADPNAGIEDEYKLVKQPNFQWRALRLLARRSDHFFTPSQTPFKALPEYLSSVIENISKDMTKDKPSCDSKSLENGELTRDYTT